MSRHQILLPDFGLGDQPITAGLWLVKRGSRVQEGDQLLEVSADAVVIDIPAPSAGTLIEMLVSEDEAVQTGQALGIIEADEEDCLIQEHRSRSSLPSGIDEFTCEP